MSADPLVWVVGSGGLLGSSVWRELGVDAWRPAHAITWSDAARCQQEFRAAVSAFADTVTSRPGQSWAVAWCAGAGVVGSTAADLAAETSALRGFLELVAAEPRLKALPGSIALASSAGGVYGGCFATPITEASPPLPISAYGRAKLEQEQMMLTWADSQPHVRVLLARFSNLYGPAQRLAKIQGLISHASRCLIHGAPLHIYVSLDTIRDYLFSDDAARRLLIGLRRLGQEHERAVTKVFASEREVSIAGLLGIFRRVTRRRLRVVSGLHAVSALQPRRLQFRSQVWNDSETRLVELVEGVSRVYNHQLSLFGRGLLGPPPMRAR